MADSALFEQLNQIVETQLRDPDLPTWIILTPWGIGETTTFMSFAHAFVETHGHSITVVVPNAHLPIANMYAHRFHKVLVADHGFLRNMARCGFISQERFELNFPLSACYIDLGLRFSQGLQYLTRYPGRGGISNTDLMRFMLRLPWNAKMERPRIPKEWVEEARQLTLQFDFEDKKSVVLFPVSNSNKTLPIVFWKKLAARLKQNGYKVFTNLENGNIISRNDVYSEPIEGTLPVTLPIHLGLSFINFAGRAIIGANGMQLLISNAGLPDTNLTILLTVPSHQQETHLSQGYSFDYKNVYSQSLQYVDPELFRRVETHEYVIPYDTSDAELERLAIVVADQDLEDKSHFNRYEINGKLFLDEHSDWLDELTYA